MDGYDELLQIDYQSARRYILEIQKFQEDEVILKRTPVRVIITSRLSLMHKAILPQNSIILKIQPFDEKRIKKWVSIWNATNSHFENSSKRILSLPNKNSPSYPFLEQPLLLLMYALLRSGNSESTKINIDNKTTLYYNLIRLFVTRELKKESSESINHDDEFELKIQTEIKKLGVISLGMLIRDKFDIRISELNDDLTYFELDKYTNAIHSENSYPIETILSKFFFVYESMSDSLSSSGDKVDPVYEFLHPTFMEFLSTNLILDVVFDEIIGLQAMKKCKHLLSNYERKISNINNFSKEWFACISHFPMFTQINLLFLLKEWFPAKLKEKHISYNEFQKIFNTCFENHLQSIIYDKQLVDFLVVSDKMSRKGKSMLSYVANYTINLVILKSIFENSEKYIFEVFEDNQKKEIFWDKLTHIWRAVYPFEQLISVTNIIKAYKTENSIELHIKIKTGANEELKILPKSININKSFSDLIAANLDEEFIKFENELNRAKEEAEKSDRLKSEFLAQMSHEFRTPINTILSFSKLLKDEYPDTNNREINEIFNVIEIAGARIIRTVDIILDMSDIQANSYDPQKIPIDLRNEIINPLFHNYIDIAKEKGLAFEIKDELNTSDCIIIGDKYTCTQIFAHIIDNAIKFTKEGSVTIIIFRNTLNTISVDITDTGIGISGEFMPDLFTPFYQEDRGYTRKYDGNGLGLALVTKYCELNNAELKVVSEKNVGSTFTVVFHDLPDTT